MSRSQTYRFLVVDDDAIAASAISAILTDAGHTVETLTSGRDVLERMLASPPDCILLDLMMPGVDGYELCAAIRAKPQFDRTRVLVVSSKSYDFDRRRARELGADGYLAKPVRKDVLLAEIARILEDALALRYWGVRGTLPVPGPRAQRYGGNTSCVTLSFPSGALFIFDAGTGIKALSDHLMEDGKARRKGHIFISHPHWDHINAIPFFGPLYVPGNEFEILGAAHGGTSVREMISAQMDGIYFPVTIREFGARVYFRDLRQESIEVEGIPVRTMLLNHPGQCLGYRIDYGGRSVCYVTDHELYPVGHSSRDPRYVAELVEFVRGTDLLITDACYTDEEYVRKEGWGHSAITEVADFAHAAQAKVLHLFHHDPAQSDDDIDAKLRTAEARLRSLGSTTVVAAPAEGEVFEF